MSRNAQNAEDLCEVSEPTKKRIRILAATELHTRTFFIAKRPSVDHQRQQESFSGAFSMISLREPHSESNREISLATWPKLSE